MKTIPILIIVIFSTILFISCRKSEHCSDAECCIKNSSSGYLLFAEESKSLYTDTIRSGETVCVKIGKLSNSLFSKEKTVTLQTEDNYLITHHITQCYQTVTID